MKQIYLSLSFFILLCSMQSFAQNAPVITNAGKASATLSGDHEQVAKLLNLTGSDAAAPGFPCDGKLYFFRYSGGKNWLSYIDEYTTATPVVQNVCSLTVTGQNAMAANPIDHYIYFTANPNSTIYRMDAACNLTTVCPTIPKTYIGTFDYLGRFWTVDNTNHLSAFDLNTCTQVKGPFTLPVVYGVDIVFSSADCHFYMGDNTHVIAIDTNGVTDATYSTGFGASGSIGGIAVGVDGNLYAVPNNNVLNSTGRLFKYDLSTHATGSQVYTFPEGSAQPCGCDMASFPCPSLTANYTASGTGCASTSGVHFTNTSSGLVNKWVWDFGDGSPKDSVTYNPTHIYASAGHYTARLDVAALTKCLFVPPSSYTMDVQVFPAAVAGITGNTPICSGQSTMLTATGGVSYVWSTQATTNPITVTPPTSKTYSVTVTDANGCTATSSKDITVRAPVAASAGNNIAICGPGSVQLGASGGVIYSWSPAAPLDNPNIANPVATVSATTTFTVVITDENECQGTATVTVTVHDLPVAQINGNTPICSGQSTTLTAEGGVSYIWSTNETTNPITITPGVTTTYSVTVTDGHTCTATAAKEVVVREPVAASAGDDVSICGPGSVQLGASGGVIYSWSPAALLDNPNIANPVAGVTETTTFTVTVTNEDECQGTATVTVTVSTAASVNIIGNTPICSGASTTLTAEGGVSYIWSTNETTNAITVTPPVTVTYSVTATDANGCTGTASKEITVRAPVAANAGRDTAVCGPGTIQLGASGGVIYSWSPAGLLDNPNIANPVATITETTTFTVTITNEDECQGTATVTVTVNEAGAVTIDPVPPLCVSAAAVTLTGHPAGGTFGGPGVTGNTFDPAVAGVGTFTITYTYASSSVCVTGSPASTTVTVSAGSSVTICASATIGCDANTIYIGYGPQSVTLTASSTATASAYQWYKNGVAIPGAKSKTYVATTAGDYKVVITGSGCTSGSTSAVYTLHVVDIRCGSNGCGHNTPSVYICHVSYSCNHQVSRRTECIAVKDVASYLKCHPQDCLGECPKQCGSGGKGHRMAEDPDMPVADEHLEFNIYPNPFTDRASLEFAVPNGGHATLELYDMKGMLVSMLFDGATDAGMHYSVQVDGSALAEGIYITMLKTNDGEIHRRLMLTK